MAEASVHPAAEEHKPRLKRPLFTKPTWAQEDKSTNSTDFFRRSNPYHVNVALEAERKRQTRLTEKNLKSATDEEPNQKRRRTSSDSDSDSGDRSNSSGGKTVEASERKCGQSSSRSKVQEKEVSASPPQIKSLPKSLLKQYEAQLASKKDRSNLRSLPPDIVDLEGEDNLSGMEQDEIVEVTAVKRSKPPPEDDELAPSDDEFAELARKPREKARRKRLETKILNPIPEVQTSCIQGYQVDPVKATPSCTPPPAAPDPVVSILVTSRISKTNPLIVNRQVSQRLKDVRLAWCQRQGFAPDLATAIFLTWRGRRLFDVTTCRSLGIGVDSEGNIVTKGQKDILGEEERQIHMEAMTEEILDEYQKMRCGGTESGNHDDTEAHQAVPPSAETKEAQVRIILKAKGYSDFKLIVKPTTRISRIVNAFKCDKRIDNDREVFCSFDGERLAPESQVGETELDDMDYVDVYVK
ncbi:MAG: hypothetical protein Q9219_006663 [cf. Caloplaca sp. 3 TL-2023]